MRIGWGKKINRKKERKKNNRGKKHTLIEIVFGCVPSCIFFCIIKIHSACTFCLYTSRNSCRHTAYSQTLQFIWMYGWLVGFLFFFSLHSNIWIYTYLHYNLVSLVISIRNIVSAFNKWETSLTCGSVCVQRARSCETCVCVLVGCMHCVQHVYRHILCIVETPVSDQAIGFSQFQNIHFTDQIYM